MIRSTLLLVVLLKTVDSIVAPTSFQTISESVQLPYYSNNIIMSHTINNHPLTVYTFSKLKHTSIQQLQNSKAIVLNSYMHARQPYSVELLKKIFQKAVEGYFSQQLDHFLENGVLVVFPFVNIDGYYEYVKAGSQQATIRKNFNLKEKCFRGKSGVDINRNFPSSFGSVPLSGNPCSQQYHGQKPFSEVESKVFETLFQLLRVELSIDIHSYGNEWIYPYASDASNSKIKTLPTYAVYQRVISELKKGGSKIQSCMQSLNYIADGVYIDWGADQGSLSLAYEVGRSFTGDQLIGEAMAKAVEDFSVVFDTAISKVVTYFNSTHLNITSSYNKKISLKVSFQKELKLYTIQSYQSIAVPLPQHTLFAYITVDGQLPQRVALAQQELPQQFNSFNVILMILLLIGVQYGAWWTVGLFLVGGLEVAVREQKFEQIVSISAFPDVAEQI